MRGELDRFGPQGAIAEVAERWPAAVGEAIARRAWPLRIARDGTVHAAAADSVWAFELGQQAGEIARRLGVPAVRFAPGPLPAESGSPPTADSPRPSSSQARAAAEIAAEIADAELRETIQRAVGLSLARAASDRRV